MSTKVIAVAAGSAMGKTVLAEMLKEEFEKQGKTVEIISEDWFYKAPTNPKAVEVVYPVGTAGDENSPAFKLMHSDDEGVRKMASDNGVSFEELKVVQNITKGQHNWSHPGAVDMDAFCDVVEGLKAQKKMTFKEFSFSTKLQNGLEHSVEAPEYLIVEGVFALTGQEAGGPRFLNNGTVDYKVDIGLDNYYAMGLARALERNLARQKSGTLEERKANIKAQWDNAYAEYQTYIEPYVQGADIICVRNDGSLEDFHDSIRDVAKKLLGIPEQSTSMMSKTRTAQYVPTDMSEPDGKDSGSGQPSSNCQGVAGGLVVAALAAIVIVFLKRK